MFIASRTSLGLSTNFALHVTVWLVSSGSDILRLGILGTLGTLEALGVLGTRSASVAGFWLSLTTASFTQIDWVYELKPEPSLMASL